MNQTRETIIAIEARLSSEIEQAALKRDLNKMVLALTESVKNLVHIAKETADAIDSLKGQSAAQPVKECVCKAPRAAKAASAAITPKTTSKPRKAPVKKESN